MHHMKQKLQQAMTWLLPHLSTLNSLEDLCQGSPRELDHVVLKFQFVGCCYLVKGFI